MVCLLPVWFPSATSPLTSVHQGTGAFFPKTENPRRRIGTGLSHRLPGVAGVYNVYAYADEMREWLDRWAEHVAGIVAPRSKPVRAKGSLAWFLGLTGTLTEGW